LNHLKVPPRHPAIRTDLEPGRASV
jgi:hypothetical protein